jgi:hypothetical protein
VGGGGVSGVRARSAKAELANPEIVRGHPLEIGRLARQYLLMSGEPMISGGTSPWLHIDLGI